MSVKIRKQDGTFFTLPNIKGDTGSQGPRGLKGDTGSAGADAKINGVNTLTIEAGANITLEQEGSTLTINSTASGGTSDYTDLTNKPSINNVTLRGNKTLNDLGIQPAGNYALESDMTEAQNDIEALQTENERLKATLPTTTGEGQDITLDKTAEMEFVKPPLPMGNTKQNTTTGKNLLPPLNSGSLNGLTFTTNSNGITTISGTTTSATNYFKNVNKILPAGTYTLSINLSYTPPASSSQLILQSIDNVRLATINLWKITSKTFTLSADTEIKNYYIFSNSGIQHNGTISIQLEEGPTATSYEPYTNGPSPNPSYPQEVEVVTGNVEVTISNNDNSESKTLPVSLGNIELCKIGDYQDYLYKNNGKWYKYNAINKLVLNGSENWSAHGSIASWFFWDGITNGFTDNTISGYALSNYFTQKAYSTVTSLKNGEFAYGQVAGETRKRFVIKDTDYTTVADFKSWLSTHNTIVYYVLATPTSTEITDVTLISQLEEISKTLSYQGQTNITSNTIDLFDVEAYQDLKIILGEKYVKPNTGIPKTDLASAVQTSLGKADTAIQSSDLTNYVTNTDYAGPNKVGVIRTNTDYGTGITSVGALISATKTYQQYQGTTTPNMFISKGTLENVIAGKGLDLKQLSTFDATKTQVLKNINGTLTWVDE